MASIGTPDIPEAELRLRADRAGGPGGQHVNKTASKITLHWNVGESAVFSDEQKSVIRGALRNRLSADDDIVLSVESERSQHQNRAAAIEKLRTLVAEALVPEIPRKATKPTRSSKERRLKEKTLHARKKAERRKGRDQNGY